MEYKQCPYPTNHVDEDRPVEMVLIADTYDQCGYFSLTFECPECHAVMVVTCYPPESLEVESNNGEWED